MRAPLLLLLSLAGCRSATEIRFEVTTDVPCASNRGVDVYVGPLDTLASRPPSSTSLTCDANGRVGAIVVVPSAGNEDTVAVELVLGVNKEPADCRGTKYVDCIVARRALHFLPHEPLVVQVALRDACRGVDCPVDQTCSKGVCVSAVVSDPGACKGAGCTEDGLPPADGGFDAGSDAAEDGADASTGAKRVFVTSKVYTGNLGGLAGADAKCQGLADAAKLGGTYKAWLADSKQRVSTRFSAAGLTGPWTLVDGTPVAADFAQLTKGTLFHALDLTELRGAPPATTAKCSTRTTSAWSEGSQEPPLSQCLDWAGLPATGQSEYGIPTVTKGWQADTCGAFGAQCLKTAALFCFEQ